MRPVAIVPLGAEAERQAITLAARLRRAGIVIELGFTGNMGKRMKRADKLGARAAIIMGEDELARAVVTMRDLDAGTQHEVAFDSLEDVLAQLR
jgi:histidyl-tRNA synthetase